MINENASTPWTSQRSNFHAPIDLFERCLNGSPRVSAKPPQPHTQEQYHLFPKKYTITGTTTKVNTIPQTRMNKPNPPLDIKLFRFQLKKKS